MLTLVLFGPFEATTLPPCVDGHRNQSEGGSEQQLRLRERRMSSAVSTRGKEDDRNPATFSIPGTNDYQGFVRLHQAWPQSLWKEDYHPTRPHKSHGGQGHPLHHKGLLLCKYHLWLPLMKAPMTFPPCTRFQSISKHLGLPKQTKRNCRTTEHLEHRDKMC